MKVWIRSLKCTIAGLVLSSTLGVSANLGCLIEFVSCEQDAYMTYVTGKNSYAIEYKLAIDNCRRDLKQNQFIAGDAAVQVFLDCVITALVDAIVGIVVAYGEYLEAIEDCEERYDQCKSSSSSSFALKLQQSNFEHGEQYALSNTKGDTAIETASCRRHVSIVQSSVSSSYSLVGVGEHFFWEERAENANDMGKYAVSLGQFVHGSQIASSETKVSSQYGIRIFNNEEMMPSIFGTTARES